MEVLTPAVHELTANAQEYRAQRAPSGSLFVRWRTLDKSGVPWLSFDWTETGGPRVAFSSGRPLRRGFGTELIEARVPCAIGGHGKVTIARRGARCHIEFPLTEAASVLETGAPRRATVFGGALDMRSEPDLGGHRIMVVEDEYYIASDTARALQGAGAGEVDLCPSEAAARAELELRRPDAVVLDINLGPGPSFDLANDLRLRAIPFIFVTGYEREAIPPEFGDIMCLPKPAQPRQIIGAIADLLGQRS